MSLNFNYLNLFSVRVVGDSKSVPRVAGDCAARLSLHCRRLGYGLGLALCTCTRRRAAGVGVALALLPRVRLELVCGTTLSPRTAVAIAVHNLPN